MINKITQDNLEIMSENSQNKQQQGQKQIQKENE